MQFSKLLIVAGLLFAGQVMSATYYVDATDGGVVADLYSLEVGDKVEIWLSSAPDDSAWSPYSSDSSVMSWSQGSSSTDEEQATAAGTVETIFSYEAVGEGEATIWVMYILGEDYTYLISIGWDQDYATENGIYMYDKSVNCEVSA